MNNKLRLAFIIIVVVQALSLVGMIGMKQWNLHNGEKILLRVVPVDPRDIFRGDYVILSYDALSRFNTASVAVEGNQYMSPNSKVKVKLQQQQGKYWVAKSVEPRCDWRTKLKRDDPKDIFLKGTLRVMSNRWVGDTYTMAIDYGIESYFVPEGRGRDIEQAARNGELYVEVSVDRTSGEAIINKLFINDKPVELK